MKTTRKVHLKFNPRFAIQHPDGTVYVNTSSKFDDPPGVRIYYPDGVHRFISNEWYGDINVNDL